jgi:glutamyl-Q tRNA(Asp) synthetase
MVVTRFAPSPTGFLHLGHAYAAWLAREAGERFLLRIEDLDPSRCRETFVTALIEDLAWLGVAWDEPVLRQSQRFSLYRTCLAKLEAMQLLYPCFCTRKEIAHEITRSAEAPQGADGPLYPGTCKRLAPALREARIKSGAPYALRLDVEKAAALAGPLTLIEQGESHGQQHGSLAVVPSLFGDIVLSRKDLPASYHLAVVADDAESGVTLVTRGNDLFAASHVQRLIQALLGLPAPTYAHHKLILDEHGHKFSKRNEGVTLRSLRQSGVSPAEIRRRLGL